MAVAPERLQGMILSGAQTYARCGSCHPGSYVPGAAQLSRGRQLIRELGCSACHQLSPQLQATLPPGRASRGPSLARAGEKLSLRSLEDWPTTVHARAPEGEWHGMPQFTLKREEARALALFLKGRSSSYGEAPDPALGTPRGPGPPPVMQADDPLRGLSLVRQARCINCHALPLHDLSAADELRTMPSANIGPSLERVGSYLASEWIEQYLADPQGHYPGTRMPDYRLSDRDCSDIAAWLVIASAGVSPRTLSEPLPQWYTQLDKRGRAELRRQGSELFSSKGCAACHEAQSPLAQKQVGPSLIGIGSKNLLSLPPAALEDFEAGRLLGLQDYFAALLAEPLRYGASGTGTGRMPLFKLDVDERRAIALALAAELDPLPPPALQRDLSAAMSMLPAHQSSGELFADPLKSAYWPWPVGAQGAGGSDHSGGGFHTPAWLSAAELRLAPEDCASCHRQQYSQWQTSRHARAMSPGITGQLVEWIEEKPRDAYDCLRCHSRLSEQLLLRPVSVDGSLEHWEHNPHFQPGLQASAHGCANCHLRGQTRLGTLQGHAAYLWDSETVSRHPLQREDWLRDSRLCAVCHQFPVRDRLSSGGPPLENTYEEWRAWAAGQAKPQSCQDCHMPGGDHSFKGIHDSAFVRRSATVRSNVKVSAGRARAELTLINTNNGHHLPTYVTPRIWLQAFFVDREGQRIDSTFRSVQVGRDARSRRDAAGRIEWYDHTDTRIPAGGEFSFSYNESLPAGAAALQLEIFVEPDHFYYNAYGDWLTQEGRSAAGKALLQLAREETEPFKSGYYLYQSAAPLE